MQIVLFVRYFNYFIVLVNLLMGSLEGVAQNVSLMIVGVKIMHIGCILKQCSENFFLSRRTKHIFKISRHTLSG